MKHKGIENKIINQEKVVENISNVYQEELKRNECPKIQGFVQEVYQIKLDNTSEAQEHIVQLPYYYNNLETTYVNRNIQVGGVVEYNNMS